MSTTYTTGGSIRGFCGHKHRTIEAAVDCAKRDQSVCARQGGYSDRYVRRSDGAELSESEQEFAHHVHYSR